VAMPALNAAIAALDTLKQTDISIVKAMANPPSGVKLVMESVCIMKVGDTAASASQFLGLMLGRVALGFFII